MTTQVLTLPIFRAFDSAGLPLAGGLLYSYAAGTTTPQATYTDASGSTPNSNPVVLDSSGSATVYLSTNLYYKLVLKDSTGATTVWTVDNYAPQGAGFSNAYSDTFTAAGTTFTLSNNPGTTANIYLSLDGATLVPGLDYNWTAPYTLTLTTAKSSSSTLYARYLEGMPTGVTDSATVYYTQGSTGSVTRTVKAKLQESVSVKDFGAVGDGVTNDDAAFVAAKAASSYVYVPKSTGNYIVNATTNSTGLYGPGTVVAGGTTLTINSAERGVSAGDATDALYRTGVAWPSTYLHDAAPAYNLVILGDSITFGNGASSAQQAYAYQFCRSIFNTLDIPFKRQTYGYHSTFNMQMALQETGISSTGALDSSGIVLSRLKLTAGQSITVTSRAMDYLDVIYDGSVSSGTLTFALNGTGTGRVHTCSGASFNNTFDGTAISTRTITEADTVTITASATVYITSILTWKANQGSSPKVFMAGQGGTTYHDFTSVAAATELAYYSTLLGSVGDPTVFMFMLGTNSIYSNSNNWTPAQTITDLNTIITNIKALRANSHFILSVPYRVNESTWPVKQAGYTYQNYVDSIVAYAKANDHGLIRNDLTDMYNGQHFSDGLHPDATGHNILTQAACSAFGIPMNGTIKTAVGANDSSIGSITLSGSWASFSGTTYAPRARRLSSTDPNTIALTGLLAPGVATTVGTLPAGYRPIARSNIYLLARGDSGPILMTIDNSGVITVGSIPATYLSLDGISFQMSAF